MTIWIAIITLSALVGFVCARRLSGKIGVLAALVVAGHVLPRASRWTNSWRRQRTPAPNPGI